MFNLYNLFLLSIDYSNCIFFFFSGNVVIEIKFFDGDFLVSTFKVRVYYVWLRYGNFFLCRNLIIFNMYSVVYSYEDYFMLFRLVVRMILVVSVVLIII